MLDIQTFYDVLPDQDRDIITQRLLGFDNPWCFGHTTSGRSAWDPDLRDIPFWVAELNDDNWFTDNMMSVINRITNQQWTLLRVYANGQTHGQSGSLHTDTDLVVPGQKYTFLYYAHPVWEIAWGGHTVFQGPDMHTHSHFPRPNSAVLFDSTIPHVGLEPTRHCPHLRITVAWKLQVQRARYEF